MEDRADIRKRYLGFYQWDTGANVRIIAEGDVSTDAALAMVEKLIALRRCTETAATIRPHVDPTKWIPVEGTQSSAAQQMDALARMAYAAKRSRETMGERS